MSTWQKISTLSRNIALATSLFASVTAFASQDLAPSTSATLHDGFYVGLAGGYDAYTVQPYQTYGDDDAGGLITLSTDSSLSATGTVGGLLGGYGKYFRDFYYMGAELFGNWSSAKAHSVVNQAHSGVTATYFNQYVKVNNNYGISFLPGLKLTPASLLYLRVGYNLAKMTGETYEDLTGGITAFNKATATVHGLALGLGMEQLISRKFSIRGEYTHTQYNEFKIGNNFAFGTLTTVRPTDNQFMLALLYHFA